MQGDTPAVSQFRETNNKIGRTLGFRENEWYSVQTTKISKITSIKQIKLNIFYLQ